jgi:hypothetical protein
MRGLGGWVSSLLLCVMMPSENTYSPDFNTHTHTHTPHPLTSTHTRITHTHKKPLRAETTLSNSANKLELTPKHTVGIV